MTRSVQQPRVSSFSGLPFPALRRSVCRPWLGPLLGLPAFFSPGCHPAAVAFGQEVYFTHSLIPLLSRALTQLL